MKKVIPVGDIIGVVITWLILIIISGVIDWRIRKVASDLYCERTTSDSCCKCVIPDTVPAQAPEDKPMQPLQQISGFEEQ